jgi:hypothetical protein
LILFEQAEALVRAGESELAGRRVAARAIPYVGEVGPPAFRFDPLDRTVVLRASEGRVEAGPADPEPWRRAIVRAPFGPVLVGPGSVGEDLRGAALAAALGAREAGRAVYLLDPLPAALPDSPAGAFAALFSGMSEQPILDQLRAAADRMPAGLLVPLVPGWTTEDAYLDRLLDRAARAGARFVSAVAVDASSETRRRVVAARSSVEPQSEETFFDRVHHGDWAGETARAAAWLREEATRRGLQTRPPRPRGEAEPAGNAAAAERLEELADRDTADEHSAALLRAAVRWIDEWSRDLAPVVAEGNFRKIFPFGGDILLEAERALTPSPR